MLKLTVIVLITFKVHRAYMTADSNRRRNAFAFTKCLTLPRQATALLLLCCYVFIAHN